MNKKKAHEAYAQYLSGIITEDQYYEMFGGPRDSDISQFMEPPYVRVNYNLGDCNVQLLGNKLVLTGQKREVRIYLTKNQVQDLLENLGLSRDSLERKQGFPELKKLQAKQNDDDSGFFNSVPSHSSDSIPEVDDDYLQIPMQHHDLR